MRVGLSELGERLLKKSCALLYRGEMDSDGFEDANSHVLTGPMEGTTREEAEGDFKELIISPQLGRKKEVLLHSHRELSTANSRMGLYKWFPQLSLQTVATQPTNTSILTV